MTDLCYRGLGDPCKRPAPRRYARCPWPWADSPKNESAASTSLSDADQKILGDVDRHMLIGELLFQFERRVFSAVIPKIRRFYGYAVRNIEQLIAREEEVADRVQFRCNLSRLNERLRPLGYLPYYHSELSCSIINEYGVLARSAAEIRTMSHSKWHCSTVSRRLIDWSVLWTIDWLIDLLIGWYVDRSIDWLIDLLIDWCVDWSIDWLIGNAILR